MVEIWLYNYLPRINTEGLMRSIKFDLLVMRV